MDFRAAVYQQLEYHRTGEVFLKIFQKKVQFVYFNKYWPAKLFTFTRRIKSLCCAQEMPVKKMKPEIEEPGFNEKSSW